MALQSKPEPEAEAATADRASDSEDTVRRMLRSATAGSHARLHINPAFNALLRGELTRPGYIRLLLRLIGLHAPIEERLASFDADPLLAWRTDAAAPARPFLLHQDLAALGVDAAIVAGTPQAEGLLPALDDPAAALGCAWVVEGSALGGRVLSSRVESSLGVSASAGGAFFAFGLGHPGRWRRCGAAIESCGDRPASLPRMVRAAVATFAAFETWLDALVP